MLKVLDLFSGIGGFSLGLERAGMETVAFCEIEDYPRRVLAKHWPDVPIAGDVRKLIYNNKTMQLWYKSEVIYVGPIDVICGGFPCQDISLAGKQRGLENGARSGLWSECARILREVRPEYAIFENVTALLNGDGGNWFKRVLWDISQVGYDAEWHCIPASELGAHHHRDRVWIIAYPDSEHLRKQSRGRCRENWKDSAQPELNGKKKPMADTSRINAEKHHKIKTERLTQKLREGISRKPGIWRAEPGVGRVADGIPSASHRLKCLGNAVVPQIPEIIGRAIIGAA